MRPSLTTVTIIGTILVGAFGLPLLEFHLNRVLTEEFEELRLEANEAAAYRKQNGSLTAAIERLQATMAVRIENSAIGKLAYSATPAPVVLDPGFLPESEWKNTGILTARDAVQSYIWAIDHGDAAALAGILSFSDSSRTRIDAVFASLTESDKAKFGSAEQMFALIYSYSNPIYFAGIQITGETPVELNTENVTTKWQYPTGQIREHTFPLTTSSDGWRRVVSDDEVNASLQKALNPTP
jgi:hypothetical protein